ncbi:MAG: hypothetical protein V4858_03185 [Pseudomonadota bacterium]
MQNPADAMLAYFHAKDGNRPHRMDHAFTADASLQMQVRQGAISFPPVSNGREAITDTLVRRFAVNYENVYTFCLSAPPAAQDLAFSCNWLVAMTEKDSRAVRVGCGRYDWCFDPASGLAHTLDIRIEAMQSLPPDTVGDVMGWVSALPYPWCSSDQALRCAPPLQDLSPVLAYIAADNA